MNWLDLTIVICLGIGLVKGLFDGIIKQVISLISLALAILFSGIAATYLQPTLQNWTFIPQEWVYPVCYVISFLLIIFVIGVLGKLLEKIWEMTALGFLNRLAGGMTGILIAMLCLSLLLNFITIFDPDSHSIDKRSKRDSILFESIRMVVPTLYPHIKQKVEQGWKDIAPLLDIKEQEYQGTLDI